MISDTSLAALLRIQEIYGDMIVTAKDGLGGIAASNDSAKQAKLAENTLSFMANYSTELDELCDILEREKTKT